MMKVVPYSITSVRHGADPGFLAVSPQVTSVINLVIDFHYFPLKWTEFYFLFYFIYPRCYLHVLILCLMYSCVLTAFNNKRISINQPSRGQFPSQRDHPPLPVPNYTAWWQRHTGVSSLPKATIRNGAKPGLEPAICKSQVRCPLNGITDDDNNKSKKVKRSITKESPIYTGCFIKLLLDWVKEHVTPRSLSSLVNSVNHYLD